MKTIITLSILFMSMFSFAQNKNAKTIIEVDGVCGMCKVRIEKAALGTKGVKSAVWSVETHQLNLIFDERKTNIKTISEKIAEAGHDNRLITATDEAYNSVHECCKYRDENVREDHKEEKKN
jgi:copper chaperone CopZ